MSRYLNYLVNKLFTEAKMPGVPDRVHFEDEVILRNIKLDSIQEEESAFKQRVDDILNPNSTYLTDFLGPDELGEDFGLEPEDAYYVLPSETDTEYISGLDDPMLEKIKGQIAKNLRKEESDTSSEISSRTDESTEQEAELNIHYSEHFTSVPYGVLPKATYTHGRKNADIMGIVYNGRMRQFVILDGKGITTWKRDSGLNGESRIQRSLMYPKYEYRLISYLVYAKKFNCYFALGKDFSLKVLNRDFIETCSVSANLRSVLFMLFNPVGDELITGGVDGTTVWKFEQDATKQLTEIKPLANYRLRRVRDLKDVGGSWVKRVDLDFTLQHLYCCSDTDLYAYDLKGQLLFKFLKAHTMSITGCIYSQFSKTLLTCSIDTEVKMWSLRGGLVHTFRGHSRAVTSIVVHPIKPSIIVTASLDGSVRMWSLNTMEILYSVVISTDGLMWMGMTDDCLMYCATVRNITLWNLNQFYDFFAVARSRICRLSLATCENKTTRVVAEGQDSSMRLFSRKSQKNLTTVLPPPDISPLQRVLSACYSREYNMVFVLITTMDIWVYTTKTDPSCRVMTWNVHDLQMSYLSNKGKKDSDNPLGGWSSSLQGGPSHRATENGMGNESLATCHSLCILTSTATMWTEEGFCSPIQNMDLEETYLLMGMEDGRILFMDPVTKGKKYMEFKASKDAIQEMRHDIAHSALITMCHLKELAMVQIWSLPQLQLLHELYCSLDIACYSRMDHLFMSGHLDGCVNFFTLEPAEDWGLFRAKVEPNKDSVVKKKRPEHNAEVVAIDSSKSMKIFCSASLNGVIRIWDENKHLVTEIFMDKLEIDENILQEEPGRKKIKVDEQGRKTVEDEGEDSSSDLQDRSLSAACFLNNTGDLIIGFKNHIFFIDHTKVCPHLTVTEEEEEVDKESAIIEDPSVIYEGGVYLPEPVTLENYLVPFDFIDFSKDFLEGKIDLEENSDKDEESETDSSLSLAPTEIYQSPLDSPWSRSMIDLTLDSEIDKFELRQRMNLTLDEINKRDGKRRKRRKAVNIVDDDDTPHASDKESEGEGLPKFDFPMFGSSPGPSPIPTPSSHPATPEPEEFVEEPEVQPQKPLDDNFVLKEVPQEDTIGHLPPDEIDYVIKHPPVPSLTPAKELESLDYPDQRSKLQKLQEKLSPESPVSSPSLTSQGRTSISPDTKSMSFVFESSPTPDTIASEWSSQWSEDVQMPRSCSNSTINIPSRADVKDANAQQQVETKTDSSEEEEVIPDRRNKYRLDNIKLDVKGLMKGAAKHTVKKQPTRKTDPSPARSDHTHAKPEEQILTPEELAKKQVEEERRLERAKKQMLKERKFPKRGNKPTRAELIAEQRRLEELKKQHPYGVAPQLSQQLNKPKEEEKKEEMKDEIKDEYPLVQLEPPDLDSFQDELWNPRETGVSGTSLMGTKLDLPQIKRGAAGTPGPRIIKPPSTPTPMSRGATPLPPENNGFLQVPSTPTPGSRQEEIDKLPDEVRRELQSRQGRISPLKGRDEEEIDRENLTPDIETAVQKQWTAQNDIPERPRSETPTAALKKLSDSRKKPPKLIRVDLPKESEGLETYRTRVASPISEMTEDRSHLSGHEADDEMIDHHGHKKHYRTRKERSLLTKEEIKCIQQRPNSSFHRSKPAETQDDLARPKTAHVRFQAESPASETEKINVALELILEFPDKLEDLQNAFEDALERYNNIHGHMLLRMQKALRSKSAAQKRQVWEEQLEEKRQKLQQRDRDTQSALGFHPRSENSFFALTQVERANTSMSYMPPLNTAKPTVQLPTRPKTAAANLQKQQIEKTALKVEKPFRYKIRQGGSETQLSRPPSRQQSEPSISPRMIDPRNPNSLRPPSTKSIPSKCTRYILVSKQKQRTGLPLPTPLEEQLLAERFPMMGERVYRQHSDLALRSKKMTYCLEYTPFVNQWA
uniref:WD repeat-containing protein 87 n=1 Tax=Magallana gigas TaxID=29159 RepID=K1RE93_MAGGI